MQVRERERNVHTYIPIPSKYPGEPMINLPGCVERTQIKCGNKLCMVQCRDLSFWDKGSVPGVNHGPVWQHSGDNQP